MFPYDCVYTEVETFYTHQMYSVEPQKKISDAILNSN